MMPYRAVAACVAAQTIWTLVMLALGIHPVGVLVGGIVAPYVTAFVFERWRIGRVIE
jgi:hypothetical protein